jgi:SAM-dependent methyltransferase
MSNTDSYINMLKRDYQNGTNNHLEHNTNPLYWSVLLKDISSDPTRWIGKNALDFGCGQGRNVTNLVSLANFGRVDGVDISEANVNYCTRTYKNQPSYFYLNDGYSLSALVDDTYDFVMSTIVFQHICVHTIRFNLKKEIYRILKPDGIFSFQMGYGGMQFKGHGTPTEYYTNMYDVQGSNGSHDVRVTDPKQLVDDLDSIGFKNITYRIEQPFLDGGHPNWIYVRCEK